MLNWQDQIKLGSAVGISPQFINDILHRRRACPAKRAHAMAAAYLSLFGVQVEAQEFVFNATSMSPIFKPLSGGQNDIRPESNTI